MSRPAPSPARSLVGLLAAEARAKIGVLGLAALVVALLDAFIVWRVQSAQLQSIVALLVAASLSLYWIFGGLTAFWTEYGSGAHLLLRSVPASGFTVLLAKYLWLLLELLVLGALLIGSALYFFNSVIPLAEVRLTPVMAGQLALMALASVLVPPAIALTASTVGRASRLRTLGAVAAFALLWTAYLLLAGASGGLNLLGGDFSLRFTQLTLNFTQLPTELCHPGEQCFVRASTGLLALQPLFAALTLWIGGRAFDTPDS